MPLKHDGRRYVHHIHLTPPAMDRVKTDLLFIPAPAEVQITSGIRRGKEEET